jgi:hypothetical protein
MGERYDLSLTAMIKFVSNCGVLLTRNSVFSIRYTDMTKVLFLVFFYSALFPAVFFFGFAILTVQYFVSREPNILRRLEVLSLFRSLCRPTSTAC